MAIHICRDFVTSTTTEYHAGTLAYSLIPVFLHKVLGFEFISERNPHYNDSYVLSKYISSGTNGSINIGSGQEYYVQIDPGDYTITNFNIGNLLALRSDANPAHNSGLFNVTGVHTASNSVIIDYRSSENPPAEVNTLLWTLCSGSDYWLYSGIYQNGAPAGEYRSNKDTILDRCVFKNTCGDEEWYIRFEGQSNIDTEVNWSSYTDPGTCGTSSTMCSITTGYHLDSIYPYDWVTGSFIDSQNTQHNHCGIWFNVSAGQKQAGYRRLVSSTPGIGTIEKDYGYNKGKYSLFIWGDDTTGNFVAAFKPTTDSTSGRAQLCMYGIPENETTPLPPLSGSRLYALGGGRYTGVSLCTNQIDRQFVGGGNNEISLIGITLSWEGYPALCNTSFFVLPNYYQQTYKIFNNFYHNSNSDNNLLNKSELFKVELYCGTFDHQSIYYDNIDKEPVFKVDPRRMGDLPMIRLGRNNVTPWVTATDKSWMHLSNGVYMPWNGPALIVA